MLRDTHCSESRSPRKRQRKRVGKRTLLACINCKERKLKCDDQVPCCANCQRFGLACLVEDPATKRHQPRNYLETLEERVVYLERFIAEHTRVDDDPLTQSQGVLQRHDSASNHTVATQLPDFDEEHENPSTLGKPDEDYDEVSDLASKVGMLSFAAGAEPHYLGSSSTFAFSRVINSALLQAISRKPGGSTRHQQDKSSLPTPCLLPDYDDCVRLSDAYFREVHAQYPFLHEPSFRDWEAKIMPSDATDLSHPDPAHLFFLYMVYAIGALLLPRLGYSAERLYAAAQLYVDDVLQLENLEAIQAYLCYAVYSLRSPAGTSVWRLSGLALRQCVEFGYHRRATVIGITSQPSPLRIELRKRAFWCAWTIDMTAATILGRPLALQQHEVDCEYPLDIDDIYITDCGILGTTRSPHDLPTNITKALFTFRIRCLWGRIHTLLYSDIDQHRSSGPDYQARVDQLRHELEEWRASLPPTVPLQGEMLSIFSAVEWFDLCYNHTIIYLYRGHLTSSSDPATDETFLECMQAAENLCHGYRREILGKPTTYTWGALHTIFVAGLTYLHCLWSSSTVRETVRQDVVSSTCTDCTIVLVLIAQWNESAAPYRDIFEELASRTMTMLVEKERERSLFPEAVSQPDVLESDHFMQWMADISEGGMADGLGDLLNGLVGEMPIKE